MISVTEHAIDRYLERIEGRPCGASPADRERVRSIIASAERGIEAAARFGATTVRHGRAKLVLAGTTIVTVLPISWVPHPDMTNEQYRHRCLLRHIEAVQ